jgi:hypothetical protein
MFILMHQDTLPFIAIEILSPEKNWPLVHVYQHNLESLLYVFIWICMMYECPGVMKNNIKDLPIMYWNDDNMHKDLFGAIKRGHILSPDNFIFLNFTSYFQNFCPLVAQLVDFLFTPDPLTSKSAVTHGDFIMIFETALSTLLPEPKVLPSSTYQ